MSEAEMPTICVNCKHHHEKPDPRNINIWYSHICQHPEVKRQEEQNPVTGEIGYAAKNDLGTVYITDESHPYCRDINHGNCPLYEQKEPNGG